MFKTRFYSQFVHKIGKKSQLEICKMPKSANFFCEKQKNVKISRIIIDYFGRLFYNLINHRSGVIGRSAPILRGSLPKQGKNPVRYTSSGNILSGVYHLSYAAFLVMQLGKTVGHFPRKTMTAFAEASLYLLYIIGKNPGRSEVTNKSRSQTSVQVHTVKKNRNIILFIMINYGGVCS